MALDWHYNVILKRWEAVSGDWCAVVARWASNAEWTAMLEASGHQAVTYRAEQVFAWVGDAQNWCEDALAKQRNISLPNSNER